MMATHKDKDHPSTDKLHRAYHAKSSQENTDVYDDWADEYEQHMKNVGYTHPAIVAAMVTRQVDPTTDPVLDAGAGTGILGEILSALGYPNIVGFDASPGMLKIANLKNNYVELTHQILGQPLTYESDAFALVVSSGVFTQGHAPLEGLDELVRVTRSGGFLVFSVARAYLDGPFEQKRQQLEQASLWRFMGVTKRYNSAPLEDALISQVFAFQVV